MLRGATSVAGFAAGLIWFSGLACAMSETKAAEQPPPATDAFAARREAMVATQIASRGVSDERVLAAMRRVPRHRFVPSSLQDEAHSDRPLPIGQQQTISQPYIVALMTELIRPTPRAKVLEIGTGSGYQAAVLAECAGEVYTIEIVPELGRRAAALLQELGYGAVKTRVGDGFDGWPEQAPFDAIVVTAAPAQIPQPLLDQLAVGGKLVIPVGEQYQNLVVVTRTEDGFDRRTVTPVRFVPMTGKAQERQ
jgi:protein-L-isoaspartate(D-aspartate) O-methyltransferase